MGLFVKSTSSTRRVNDLRRCEEECKELYNNNNNNINNNGGASTTLTVWRKSLLMSCSGFTVIDGKGDLVYRVDNYRGKPFEIVLMDASGTSLFTMRRHKTLRLVDDWVVYKGEAIEQDPKTRQKKQPICYVKKTVSLLQAGTSSVLAHVYLGTSTKNPAFVVEGSYGQRSCKIFDKLSKNVVAEIKRKEAVKGASFGLDVFNLIVSSGFDSGFAMTLVLLLDQMFS